MKKLVLLILVIVFSTVSSACNGAENLVTNIMKRVIEENSDKFLNEDELAKKTLGSIITAIETKDKETLLGLFSETAIDEAENLEENTDEFFCSFDETELELIWDVGPVVTDSYEYGKHVKEFEYTYELHGAEQTYYVYIFETVIDTECPENVGVYALRIVKEEDAEQQLGRGDEKNFPGIYYKPSN